MYILDYAVIVGAILAIGAAIWYIASGIDERD